MACLLRVATVRTGKRVEVRGEVGGEGEEERGVGEERGRGTGGGGGGGEEAESGGERAAGEGGAVEQREGTRTMEVCGRVVGTHSQCRVRLSQRLWHVSAPPTQQ
jgi:hypothetical protein